MLGFGLENYRTESKIEVNSKLLSFGIIIVISSILLIAIMIKFTKILTKY